MDRNIESVSEHSTCVLLPVYSAMKLDIFLDILKKTVSRTPLSEDSSCNAFVAGFSAATLSIKFEDLSTSMLEMSSTREIRLLKLLGFWAASNFPTLGKKFLGDQWSLQKVRTITIGDLGHQQTITPDDLDARILKDMKLRVIELTVKHSTIAKIKHFVTVPHNVCKDGSNKISIKMKTLDIHDSLLENCWHALKSGRYLSNVSEKKDEMNWDIQSDSLLTVRRASIDIGPSQVSAKKPRVDFDVDRVNSHSCVENLQPVLEAMGNDITKLTYLMANFKKVEESQQIIFELQNSLIESSQTKRESVDGRDALQKQLDVIMNENEELKKTLRQSELQNLEGVSQNKIILDQVNEIRNVAEDLKKTLSQSDKKNLDLVAENERMKGQFNESDCKKQELVGEIEALRSKFREATVNAEKSNENLKQSNQKMAQHLIEWETYGANMQNYLIESDIKKQELVSEMETLRLKLNETNANAEKLNTNLVQSNQRNLDLAGENERLANQLNEWKTYGANMQNYLLESDFKKQELVGKMDTLRSKMIEMNANADELNMNLKESDQKNVQLVDENEKLWQRMNELKADFDEMVKTFRSQIQNISMGDGSTIESEKENVGTSSVTSNEAQHSLRSSNRCRPKTEGSKTDKNRRA